MHKTIEERKTVIKQVLDFPSASLEAWYVDERHQIVLQQGSDNMLLYRNGEQAADAKQLYEAHVPPFPLYQSCLCANADGRKVALPMMFMNRIGFYDFESGNQSAASLYEPTTMPGNNLHVYYCSTCTDGNYVYALYMNQSNEDSYMTSKSMEIHVFNFDGVYVRRFMVSEYIIDIACDAESLYGVDLEGSVYKYSGLIKNLYDNGNKNLFHRID